jgi:predicted small lipoprotein YifL
MILKWAVAVIIALSVAACGVKSDLDLPSGMQVEKTRPDPSRPPQPLGQ